MDWKLFLDDVRVPTDIWKDTPAVARRIDRNKRLDPVPAHAWKCARNSIVAIDMIMEHGLPTLMSLDHDLGYYGVEEDNGMVFLKQLVMLFPNLSNSYVNECIYLHSQNPVGKANMLGYLRSYMKANGYVVCD